MNKILFVYLNAFSQTGGIQTFNKYFIAAMETIQSDSKNLSVNLLSIYDHPKDVKSLFHFESMHGKKSSAIPAIISKANKYDTFIFGHVNLAPLAWFIHILNPKARIVFCTHGIEVWHQLPLLTRKIMNDSTVLAVSSFTKNELKKFNPQLNNIRIFPNCIQINPIEKSFINPYHPDTFNILSVTRLDPSEQYKGIHTVIHALPSLIQTIPNIRYTVIGKGDDLPRLRNIAETLGVSHYIDFLGFVDDLQAYYQHCDIFTLPSKKEGFGIVYLEAMQYKKPVLAVNYGGPTDVIVDGETGYLCEYNDEHCLVEKIETLHNDPSLSNRLGGNGYQRLIENFTFEKFTANLQSVVLES